MNYFFAWHVPILGLWLMADLLQPKKIMRPNTVPRIQQGNTHMYLAVGNNAILLCDVKGRPKPTRTWEREGKPVRKFGRRFSINKKSFALRIFRLRAGDGGNYTCIAKNREGMDSITVGITIAEMPFVSHVVPDADVIHENETLRITCTARAKPRPHIQWSLKNKILLSDSRTNITETELGDKVFISVLEIFNVTYLERGDYTCRCVNNMGSHSQSTHIDVLYPPRTLSTHDGEVVHWWEGHVTNLTCDVSGNEPPEVTWFLTDTSTNMTSSVIADEERSEDGCLVKSTMILNPNQDPNKNFSGIYKCRAENSFGNMTIHEYTVKRAYAQSSLILTPLTIADYQMVLSIILKPQEDTPPVHYVLARYRLKGEEEEKFSVTCGVNKHGYCHVTFLGVMPNEEYVVSARAKNKVGFGDEVSMVVVTGESEYGWTMQYTTMAPYEIHRYEEPRTMGSLEFFTTSDQSTSALAADVTASGKTGEDNSIVSNESYSTPAYQLLSGNTGTSVLACDRFCLSISSLFCVISFCIFDIYYCTFL